MDNLFGAELSGGVPGAGDGMKKSNLLAMLKHGRINYKKRSGFESKFEIWTS